MIVFLNKIVFALRTDIEDCASDPCLNGYLCEEVDGGGFTCNCDSNMGDTCRGSTYR